MTMIEKIARAIASEAQSQSWQDYLSAARAAISAMHEPDLEMLEAALPGMPDWGYLPEDWATMINFVARQPVMTVPPPANGSVDAGMKLCDATFGKN